MKSHRTTSTAVGLAVGGAILIALGLMALGSRSAAAAEAAKELATAEQHAGYAASAKNLKMVHAHLQHVINCLVGPEGAGFDAKALNPCKGFGSGAIPDTSDAAKTRDLEQAVKEAQQGLAQNDLVAARKDATVVGATLKKAM